MESEIFKFICANQGAVNTDDLLFNLNYSNVSEVISNREKFVLYCAEGQPKVVVRTGLRLCRARDCAGTCRQLHLCKNFLFSGSCHFTRLRRGCNFSHDLNSEHNQGILRQHELESLSRTELCTLLLQSDNTLLPAICFDYNNGLGEYGRCQEGNDCKRMHICEGYLNGDCSCFRAHDFNAPQPLKSLKDKGVPDDLFRSLKAVYTNKEALRKAHRANRQPRSSTSDACALNVRPVPGTRGRGRGRGRGAYRGNRGNRASQSKLKPEQRACSSSDILDDIDALNLYTDDGLDDGNSDSSASANNMDVSSEDGQSRKQMKKPYKPSAAARGRDGNHQPLQRTRSTNDLSSAVSDPNSSTDQNKAQRQKPVRDKTEICMYFIKGHCMHNEKCFKAHTKMPYRWEVKEDDQWKALPDNEAIEKDYCDPKNTYSSHSPPVHFDTMTYGTNQVRRLSTINSLLEPTFIHTTEWVWYWEDEFGSWNLYASAPVGHRAADIDSAKLEQKFLENDKDVLEFTAGSQSYTLSFQDMIQTNKRYGTKRLVKRRPRFVSAADVKEKRVRRPLGLAPIPDHWDKTQIPPTGYKRILLQRLSEEFKEVEALFGKTMIGFDIVKVERIQNKSLWEVFQWQRNQMMNNNNGRNVTEKKLFHGTDSKYVDAICSTNFDWRICGTHGTAFGKGSYFARDAKYSHSYTDDSDVKSMFVSRVLVGDFAKGSSEYRRPPSKDGGDINFFDSCVDDITNPSIFVVFEKHQVYPEYLLQYKNERPQVGYYGGASAPALKPKPSVSPHSTALSRPSTALSRPSTTLSRPSTTLSRPSTALSRPSTAAYRASMSSSQASMSSSQSSTPSYQFNPYSYQTNTPSYLSNAASYSSSTSYQPSTSAYQYRTSQSSPSPSPSPTPKKSDSCVIG